MSDHERWDVYESPIGRLTVTRGPSGLTGLHFPGPAAALDERARDADALAPATTQLEEYFAGARRTFELPLALGGTPFQRAVWEELRNVPFGATLTYTELAQRVGRPDVVRAIGAAVGRTPVPIIVPCHRVVASDGALAGYRGGLHRKRALLDLERDGGPAAAAASAVRQLAFP